MSSLNGNGHANGNGMVDHQNNTPSQPLLGVIEDTPNSKVVSVSYHQTLVPTLSLPFLLLLPNAHVHIISS
jgi:hypothetical protein